jgi:branched-chain amino acid transport system substrate-binding protein
MTLPLLATAAVASALALMLVPAHADQGVSKDEITLGTIQDLSGPIAAFGKQARLGMLLRVEEINEQGGIHGRKVKLVVEDSGYDPKKAVLAAQKLVNQDRIFAMVGHIGTAQNMAAMPVQFEKNVINFLPVSAAREMVEPFHRLKFGAWATYLEQMGSKLPGLVKEKGAKKVCAIYQDDEFGLEVLRGGEAGLKKLGMSFAEKTSFKRGATDFSSQVARMKAAGCDFVVMGTIIRETIGTMAESHKIGFAPTFFASYAAYTDLIHRLGGPVVNGLYAAMVLAHPYLDDAAPNVRVWADKYKSRFNEDPTVLSAYGYTIMDAFVSAAQKAGPGLSTDGFIKAMETMTIPADIFGGPELKFGPEKRLGSDISRLSQLIDGRWRVVADYE